MTSLSRQTFHAGAQIFREGEPGSCAYIIESGSVSVTSYVNGRPYVINTLSTGDIFGEMALVDDNMRSASVTAVEETEVIRITREYVKEKLTKTDPLSQMFLRAILEKFRDTQHQLLAQNLDQQAAAEGHARNRTSAANRQAIGKIRFEHELQEALSHHETELSFQPIVSLQDDRIQGFEALARWNHPERGLLQPQDFLGTAHDSGLIVALGREVLRQSCDALKVLQAKTKVPLMMGVNVSAQELARDDFTSNFLDTISRSGARPGAVKLEITEQTLIENPDGAAIALDRISKAGVKVAIDDFGTGFSSFTCLCRFPIDTLKIDRSFVENMLQSQRTMEIVKALINLSASLNMQVIAEGIETPQQLECLRKLNCDSGQGYYFSSPLDLHDACEYVQHQ